MTRDSRFEKIAVAVLMTMLLLAPQLPRAVAICISCPPCCCCACDDPYWCPPESCDLPPPAGGGAPGSGGAGPDGPQLPTDVHPFSNLRGAATDSVPDLQLGAIGSPNVQWNALRTYASSGGPGSTLQGHHWVHNYLDTLTLADPGSPASSNVTWRPDARRTLLFTNAGSYAFTCEIAFWTLTHEHTGDPADTYRVEASDGTLYIFYDNEHSATASRLKLSYIEDLYGNRLTIYRDATSGEIDYITDASGHHMRYSYLASGDNTGKLDYVRVFKGSGTSDADLIARIEYTYKASSDGLDSGCGTTGDLVKVVVKTHKTAETGTTFSIVRTTHYRYDSSHRLKMILRPEHFQRADDALTDPLTSTDAQVDDYATAQFQYDVDARLSQLTIAGGGSCGGCGGGDSDGVYDLTYSTQTSSARNDWTIRCKFDKKSGSNVMATHYFYTNNYREPYKHILLTNDSDHTKPLWAVQYDRDTTGRITTIFTPSAISDFNSSTHALTYVNDGQVIDFTYYGSTRLMASKRLRKYSESTADARYLGLWEYSDVSWSSGYRTRPVLTSSYVYPTETTSSTDSSRLQTQEQHVYTSGTDRPLVTKVTYPTVTTTQNGPNVAASEFSYFDSVGRVRWHKDAEGGVHYRSYHDLTGAQTYSVQDVYTGTTEGAIKPTGITSPEQDGGTDIWADWTGAAPNATGGTFDYDFRTSPSSYTVLQSKRLMDLQGRLRRTTDANNMQTYFAHLDGETRTYAAWIASTDKPLLPARRVKMDKDGRTTEVIEVDPTTITFSDPPVGSEDLSDQSKWASWTVTSYDSSLRRSTTKAYRTIPSSGPGTAGTDYYQITYSYGDDTTNRLTYVQVKDPEAGYSKTWSNARGQRTKVEGTATESGGNPSAWKTLTEYFYDESTPGNGTSKGGNGNLTQMKSYYGDSSSNSTSFTYDWRGRQLFNGPPDGPKTLNKHDNLGRIVASAQVSNGTSLSSSSDPTATTFTGRLALSETFYNNRGQVYQSKQWEILEANGNKDASLVSDLYYDRVGRTVAVKSPGAGIRVSKYNLAGQVTESHVCTSLGSTIYNGGGDFDYSASDNKIVEKTDNGYSHSAPAVHTTRLLTVTRSELKPSANAGIGNGGAVIDLFQRFYYDKAGRRTQVTDLGSNEGTLNGGMKNGTPPASIMAYDPDAPESRGDFALVTTWTHDAKGRLQNVNDADNKETRHEYDALGRRTAMIEDYGGLARRTEYQYNGNSDTTKLIARDVDEYGYAGGDALEDQVTEYIYGHGVNKHWVTEIRYPGSNGQASSASADKVVFTYNHDGTVATRTDQNQSVITYDQDTSRRKIRERVTTVGSNVDNAVLQIVTTYDSSGRVQKLTSRDSSTADSGNIVNEVKHSYNGFGQLTKDEQEHAGAVGGSTLSVQYAYTESTANNHSRLDSFTYPNARDIFARYTHSAASTTWQDEIADAFSRTAQFSETSGSPGDVYVEYSFAGLNRMTKRESKFDTGYKGNDTALNFDAGTAGQYDGLDTFGRISKSPVNDEVGTTTRTDIQYNANRDSSPKFAEPQSATVKGRSNLYSYDGLHRLTQADTGTLNSGRTDILTEWSDPGQLVYSMDILGNFSSIDRKNSGTSATETRTHNATNELLSRTVAGEAARLWMNDPFTDNNTNDWAAADLNTSGGDGTWAAASGALSCSGTCTPTGHSGVPGGGACSALLVNGPYYQDVLLTASATVQSGGPDVGIIFSYRDRLTFWAKIWSLAGQTVKVYEVSAGTWTQRSSSAVTITAGTAFTMEALVRAGTAGGYATTLPAGQVGLISFGSSNNSMDNAKCHDLAGPYEVDGRWFCEVGDVQVDSGSYSDKLAITSTVSQPVPVVRRGFRAEKFVSTFKFYWSTPCRPGMTFAYQDPSNWYAVEIRSTDSKPRLLQRTSDGNVTVLATDPNAMTLTNNTWYTAKVVVDAHPTFPTTTWVRLIVDTDNDGDFADEAAHLGSTVTGSVGYLGLFRGAEGSTVQQFDDFKAGTDNSSPGDDDFADGGDEIVIDDNFNSNTTSLAYDDNGNLTDDGIFKFVYDAWNRLAKAKHRSAANPATIGTYSYDAADRRTKKVVTSQGPESTPNDGGNTTVNFYYGDVMGGMGQLGTPWSIFEERDGSSQTVRQYQWGTRYVDELLWMETNGDPTIGNDANPDNSASGESSESPADKRYFVHQDRNWNVVAITEYDPADITNGRVTERIRYFTPYGRTVFLPGNTGNPEASNVGIVSTVGNAITHQGLITDHEAAQFCNRHRGHLSALERFMQREPLTRMSRSILLDQYQDGLSLYMYERQLPNSSLDPSGLCFLIGGYIGGQYCGVGACQPGYTNAPRDCVDATCRLHDYCYDINQVSVSDPPWHPRACEKRKCDAMLCDLSQDGIPGYGPCNPTDIGAILYRLGIGAFWGCLCLPPWQDIHCGSFSSPLDNPPPGGVYPGGTPRPRRPSGGVQPTPSAPN